VPQWLEKAFFMSLFQEASETFFIFLAQAAADSARGPITGKVNIAFHVAGD
jgi:hypothetical protein